MEKKWRRNNKKYNLLITVIDSVRFMASSLSNLANILSEGIHRINDDNDDKKRINNDDKKCETCEIKCKYYNCFQEYTNFKDDLIECIFCVVTKIINTSYQNKFDEM